MLLGEAQSKCKHIAGALLDPQTASNLHRMYLVKGALATTAIEGNTLSEEQVKKHLLGELVLPKSKEYLKQEIDNILKAFNEIADAHFREGNIPLCVEEIEEYNKLVLNNLPLQDEDIVPGEIRKHRVTVGRYVAPNAAECRELLERLCIMLEGENFTLGEDWAIASGVMKAIIAHLYIAWIHPFGDGNGRTARLVEFRICISSGVPDPAAHLLSNHYNETRSAYYNVLDQTSKTGNPFPFINYALQGFVDQLEEQIVQIRIAQHKVFWRNYIHTVFQKEKDSPSSTRRRRLMLDISEKTFETNEWIALSDIVTISPRVGRAYSGMTSRALSRDINRLVNLGLLAKKGALVKPKSDIILAYLPRSV
jgi:Fic family protein